MGGFGSSRWRGHIRKVTVEECLVLDVAELAQGGIIGRHGNSASTLEWEWPSTGERVVSVGCAVEPAVDGRAIFRLRYSVGRGGSRQDVDLPVLLQTTRPQFGGVCWWFTCPLESDDQPCNRRIRKLYLPPGSDYFGYRICHALTYQSSQECHRYDRLSALTAW